MDNKKLLLDLQNKLDNIDQQLKPAEKALCQKEINAVKAFLNTAANVLERNSPSFITANSFRSNDVFKFIIENVRDVIKKMENEVVLPLQKESQGTLNYSTFVMQEIKVNTPKFELYQVLIGIVDTIHKERPHIKEKEEALQAAEIKSAKPQRK